MDTDAAPRRKMVGEASAAPEPEVTVISSRTTNAVHAPEGPPIKMRVTAKGHGQISAGTDNGYDRYARWAKFEANDLNARLLFNKGWAEPIEDADRTIERWERMDAEERRRDMASLKARDAMLERGAMDGGWNG